MPEIHTLTATDGSTYAVEEGIKATGGMKDVYFSPNRDYVVAFYRVQADAAMRERLAMITGTYRERIFNQAGGDYWQRLFCWPTAMIEYSGRLGVVVPFYDPCFFFQHGSSNDDMLGIRGKEKQGKWFTSPSNRSRYLDPRERGDWLQQLRVCLMLSRGVRRLHAAGLAHSDLSYRNVLTDPGTGRATIIDIDGLVVAGKYPPEVLGTPDFIAPECVMTAHLQRNDPQRKLPSINTDQHALAVLIYMLLLLRHPLRGDQVHDLDPQRDEHLAMGERALFVEHPDKPANRINPQLARPSELPWKDTARLPYTLTGPYLSALFLRAFTTGLHDPAQRPTADQWEHALVKTLDLLQPCANTACEARWYVFDNSTHPACPFCGTPFKGHLPILNLYSSLGDGQFRPDNHRLMVYSGQSLFAWHVNRTVFPNEKLTEAQKTRLGYFVRHQDVWYLVNEGLPDLRDAQSGNAIPPGDKIALSDGQQLLLARQDGGRLAVVQMVVA